VVTRKYRPRETFSTAVTTVTTNYEKNTGVVVCGKQQGGTAKTRVARKTQDLFRHPVVTPVSGAHSTLSQTTPPADQDELIRNLVALGKEDPSACSFTLALKLDPRPRLGLGPDEVTALLKTDATRLALVEAGVSTPLVTSISGRQQ